MTAKKIWEWNQTAALNNFVAADGGWPEGMDRSAVNEAARVNLSSLASFYETGMEFLDIMRDPTTRAPFVVSKQSDTVVRIVSGTNDVSAFFNQNRRIRTFVGGVPTANHFVESATYSDPNCDVTIRADDPVIPAGCDGIKLHSMPTLGRLAFENTFAGDYVVPADNTDAEFAVALGLISTAGGGTLLLRSDGPSLLTQQHTISGFPIRILGNGPQSGIKQSADGLASLLRITGTSTTDVILDGFTVDGSRATYATGTGDGILIEGGAQGIALRNVRAISTRRHGVYLNNSNAGKPLKAISFSGYSSYDTGGDGIGSADTHTTMNAIRVNGAYIDTPGQLQTDSAGIYAAGQWNIDSVRVDNLNLGGGSTQRGIWFAERIAADPNAQSAIKSVLTNFTVTGSGGNARGVEANGEDCAIANGVIHCYGGSSRGIMLTGYGGSQTPRDNEIDNVLIQNANIGVHVGALASKNSLRGISTRSCTTDMLVDGTDNYITGFHGKNSGTNGVVFSGTSADNLLEDSRFIDTTNVAVVVQASASGNRIQRIGTQGSATPFSDAGTRTIADDIEGVEEVQFWQLTGVATPYLIQAQPYKATTGVLIPDGTRKWQIEYSAKWESFIGATDGTGAINLHSGSLGTNADPTIGVGHHNDNTNGQIGSGTVFRRVTPAAGDTLSVYNPFSGTSNASLYLRVTRVRGS